MKSTDVPNIPPDWGSILIHINGIAGHTVELWPKKSCETAFALFAVESQVITSKTLLCLP